MPADEDALVALGVATGLFTSEEADGLLRASLRGIFDGSSDRKTHAARVVDTFSSPSSPTPSTSDHGSDGAAAASPAGWTYLSADPSGPPHVWELWWIGVSREAEGKGYASALLEDAESFARGGGATCLLICTSSTDATARARAFYERAGYRKVGQIPGYYGQGDDKVIFWKALQ